MDGQISQAENSFTSKHFMKKLLLINHADSCPDAEFDKSFKIKVTT